MMIAAQRSNVVSVTPLGDHPEIVHHAASRRYLTGLLVLTDADEDQRYGPNCDDEVMQAAAIAMFNEN